jgi:predicted dehydrogenase
MMIYRYIKNAKVVAVSDIDLEKARIFANEYRVDKTFTNHVDLLEMKDLDFIDVCTPPSTHARMVCDAASSGHNVLLEKPMALSTHECERMIHEVERHGVSLCICHNQIFFPAMRRVKYLVDSGDYDIISFRTSIKEDPHMFSVPAWNMTSKEKGIIWEVGCHPAYLHLHLLGNIAEVYAVGSKVKYPVFDEFSVLLRTSGQPYGIMEISWLTKESEKIYEIDSSDGKRAFMIAPPPWANQGYDILLETSGNTERGLYSEIKRVFRRFVKRKTLFGYFIGHFYLINSYIKSLVEGTPPPVPPEEGRKTVKLLECIEQSLNTHEIVSVK